MFVLTRVKSDPGHLILKGISSENTGDPARFADTPNQIKPQNQRQNTPITPAEPPRALSGH